MKKMLYMCAIEWEWIAQRPHFLAIELEKFYEITVASPVHILKKIQKQRNTELPHRFLKFPLIPFQERIRILSDISRFYFNNKIGNMNQFDVVWLGSPLYGKYIPSTYEGLIIYDFMDDCISMQHNPEMKKTYSKQHRDLIKRSNLIYASSEYLKNMLPQETQRKTRILRNAFRGKSMIAPVQKLVSKPIRIGYVGTISEWMDWELLDISLKDGLELQYHFWGPIDGWKPEGKGYIFHGVIEHSCIPNEIRDMDALIMPFVVNDTVKAVDPVKLYEYISYGKTIISVFYDEVKRFEKYVWFYNSIESYLELLIKLGVGQLQNKYSEESQKVFLEENTWEKRAEAAWLGIEELHDN